MSRAFYSPADTTGYRRVIRTVKCQFYFYSKFLYRQSGTDISILYQAYCFCRHISFCIMSISRMLAVHSNINETCFRLLLSDVLYIFNAVSELSKKTHTKNPSKQAAAAGCLPRFVQIHAVLVCLHFRFALNSHHGVHKVEKWDQSQDRTKQTAPLL